jgi:hypothetical protein
MTELHPQILTRDGKPEFVVLPYEEFISLREQVMAQGGVSIVPDPRYGGFWENLSAEELARRQGVKPVESLADLYWPYGPEDWEGFDEALAQWRKEAGPAE